MHEVPIQPEEAKFCLYARKSTEGDEKQAMSIDSQIKEMKAIAERDGIKVVDVREEKFSAKMSGTRPVFNSILGDIREGKFDAILTWAPDRLSRNAGDLGMLVDLIDQGKLKFIKTYSQTFTNSPNEKFLLMILCSQAKLENDNKGINVKRGIRAKCEMGWRPGVAPLGYFNRAFNGVKDIIIDPERAPIIKESFERVAIHKQSGRQIKRWMDTTTFRNRSEAKFTLSQVYGMLKNPFYYGEFKYPLDSDHWYKGAHEPIITKELFEKAQIQLKVAKKSKWGAKQFVFKGLFTCGECGGNIVAEEKFKRLLNGQLRRHVYYRCSKYFGRKCSQPYLNEVKLLRQLRDIFSHVGDDDLKVDPSIRMKVHAFKKIQNEVLLQNNLDENAKKSAFSQYTQYVLWEGSDREKRDLIKGINQEFILTNSQIAIASST